MGYMHTMILTTNNELFGCGNNSFYQIGYELNDDEDEQDRGYLTWRKISSKHKYYGISCGMYHNIAIRDDGKLCCWGSIIDYGQCGIVNSK